MAIARVAAGTRIATATFNRALVRRFSLIQSGARSHVAMSSTTGIGNTDHQKLTCIVCISSVQPQSVAESNKPAKPAMTPLRISIDAHWPAA